MTESKLSICMNKSYKKSNEKLKIGCLIYYLPVFLILAFAHKVFFFNIPRLADDSVAFVAVPGKANVSNSVGIHLAKINSRSN